jgi:hypothetical protein
MEKKGNKYKVLCDVMIIFVYTTKYDAKKLQHSYAQLKMENSKTFTSQKKKKLQKRKKQIDKIVNFFQRVYVSFQNTS